MNDGAEFIRNLGSYIDGACNSPTAIAFGYSQSALHLRMLLFTPEFWGGYDGYLSGGNVFPLTGKSITVTS